MFDLGRYLEDRGFHDEDGVHRRLGMRWCPRCRAKTLRGLDADVLALAVVVDAAALTGRGEALALLTGRSSYTVRPLRVGICLDGPRTAVDIAAHPAETTAVLAEHLCGRKLPADAYSLPPKHSPTPRKPPF